MSKRAVLRLTGTLEQGVQVTLEVQENQTTFTEVSAALPGNPELAASLQQWRQSYSRCVTAQSSRISLESITVEPGPQTTLENCRKRERSLQQHMSDWLASEAFRPVDQRLREALSPQEEAQLLLRGQDERLHRLPWQVWNIVERYPYTEIVFGSAPERVQPQEAPSDRVRVLAILGDRRNIDTDVDRSILQSLPQAEVTFLVEPSRKDVESQLWNQPWDILFFAGHSYSEGSCGRICINPDESLTLDELRYGLRRAIARGLQLAIFNSCDGLGIAYELEQLHLPQLVVMREPVPDQVAQEFLKYFLAAFSRGEALHLALREARERLQGLETNFPSPTWLPVLFQNPAVDPPAWASFCQGAPPHAAQSESARFETPGEFPLTQLPRQEAFPAPTAAKVVPRWTRRLTSAWGIALGAALVAMGGRYVGMLQQPELKVFDHLLRSRPAEPRDERILVVNITEADVINQPEEERQGRSLSDQALSQLLTKLNALQPRNIGLDLYREQATDFQPLVQQFSQMANLFAICKGDDPTSGTPAIAKPPDVPDGRVGFSGIRSDGDKIVRMQVFSASIAETRCMDYSLALSLAYDHLEQLGIRQKLDSDSDTWQWQTTKFRRIGASLTRWPSRFFHYGPYAGLDARGHQFLLNYRATRRAQSAPSPIQAFEQVTMGQVLDGSLQMADVKDKTVLIGVNLEDRDRWLTPYRTEGKSLEVPGVYLHAQMTSQILSAVLDGRPILWALPYWMDSISVFFVTMMVVLLLRRSRSLWGKVLIVGGCGIALYVVTEGLLIVVGLYLPLLPSLLALGLASLAVARLDAVVPLPSESASRESWEEVRTK